MRLPEGLPDLKGRWLTAYKMLWFALLAASLAGITAGQWRQYHEGAEFDRQMYGAGLRPTRGGDELVVFSPISPAARAAGIAPDSVLLAVDGRPVRGGSDFAALERASQSLDGRDGQALALRMRAPDGAVAVHRVVRGLEHLAAADAEAPLPYHMRIAIAVVSRTLSALIMLAGALLLFRRRPSDPVVALLAAGMVAFPAGDVAALFEPRALAQAVAGVFYALAMCCILLGMTIFPAGRFSPRWSLLILPAIAAWAVAIFYAPGMLIRLAIALPALAIAVGSLGWRYSRLQPGPQRQQIKWVVLGFAAFVVSGLIQYGLQLLDRSVTSNQAHFALLIAINAIGAVQPALLVGGLVISLLRHRLYDADAAISRSAVYAGLTVTLIAIFAATEKLIETLGEEWFGGSAGAAAGAIAAGLAALFLVPLHHRMSHWAEKRFQRDLARLRADLPELIAELRDSTDPSELADDALRLITRGVRASHGAILLAEGGGLALVHAGGIAAAGLAERLAEELPAAPQPGFARTDDHQLPVRLPLVTPGGSLAGWLLLGPHPDGSLYGKDDREALEEFASPLARALCLAIERERREAEREAERRRLGQRMTRLEKRLAQILKSAGAGAPKSALP